MGKGVNMINVAIVEDDDSASQALYNHLKKYEKENGEEFTIIQFPDAVSFLNNFHKNFDIVFMDIELPKMNGMNAARKMRELDDKTIMIFVTNFAQFAVKGYEVDALDFIVKPIIYSSFALKLKKAIIRAKNIADNVITIMRANGATRVAVNEISYVEIIDHYLYFHLNSETIVVRGSLSETEKKLGPYYFMRCNNCFLVNPQYIKFVDKYVVTMVNGDKLQISQPRKKKFMEQLAKYLGGSDNI